jgi:hypothetical protein
MNRLARYSVAPGLVLALMLLTAISIARAIPATAPGVETTIDRAGALAANKSVAEVVWYDQESRLALRLKDGAQTWVAFPSSGGAANQLLGVLIQNGAHVRVDQERDSERWRLLATGAIPALVIAIGLVLMLTSLRAATATRSAM